MTGHICDLSCGKASSQPISDSIVTELMSCYFIYDCCKILIEYRGIIKNQSTRTDVAEEAEQSAEPLPAAGQPGVNEAPDPTQLDLNP